MEPRQADLKAIFCEALDARPARTVGPTWSGPAATTRLRDQVEDLLAAHDCPGGFLSTSPGTAADEDATRADSSTAAARVPGLSATDGDAADDATGPPTAASPPTFRPLAEGPGSRIGPYKLRQEIGEGGMGTVYLAEQTQPVKRQVALKLIKAGHGLEDGPRPVRVRAAGPGPDGPPATSPGSSTPAPPTAAGRSSSWSWSRASRSPTTATSTGSACRSGWRCSARSARPCSTPHQKGIIHRDLKPSNILVESHDGQPVPKVIDFGLAKATSGLQLSEHSLFTAFGSVAGTPLYMAPEQASFNALDVDTRADIYALGVILYELLTGSTPIQRETFKKAALDEMLRMIREDEPPTPSSRISTSEALPSLAATRQTEPARLGRFVRGDLDWIVMKALAKERQRRYESADRAWRRTSSGS